MSGRIKFITVLICGIVVMGIAYTGRCQKKEVLQSPQETIAWLTYWDAVNGVENLIKDNRKYDGIAYFAAYFNEKDELFIPDQIKNERKLLQEKNKEPAIQYLSIVNDVKNGRQYKLKDIEVVKKTLTGSASQILYADEIITLAQKNNFTGIEIDYEHVFKDKEIAQKYIRFLKILYNKASAKKLKMRVILEPGTDFSVYDFPEGPQYIVMMYNLYGTHSGPGPKADFNFIEKTIKKMKDLPGYVGAAFSNGGCLWSDTGKKRFISKNEAEELARKSNAVKKRDKKSWALFFSYKKDNVKYTVWYADEETINKWIEKAADSGIHTISIWQLGNE